LEDDGPAAMVQAESAVVFEEAGYSTLGPLAMNLFAPDEGNMHLMEVVATADQKNRWLAPLASGQQAQAKPIWLWPARSMLWSAARYSASS
ncbi:MAG: hypothetical protein EBS16_10880, partial [Betaproteobacteria bacterium]|nr:hypothetical protein [Betaproteobacteria bacterium]